MKGQDQGNGTGEMDRSVGETETLKGSVDVNGSVERFARTTFHCCTCYKRAVEYDHATIEKDLLEQAVRTAGDVVIDSKFNKEDTEEARAFLMEFIRKQKAKL